MLGTLILCVAVLAAVLAVPIVWALSQFRHASEAGKAAARQAGWTTLEFYRCMVFFIRGGKFSETPYFGGPENKGTRVRLFGLCLTFRLWSEPHYRHGTFQDDLRMNLRNVAVPGTGIPLSVFAVHKILAYFLILVLFPLYTLAYAIKAGQGSLEATALAYIEQLLRPTDWFNYWRLNCALASYHSLVTGEEGYALEDKLTFLQVAELKDVAVSPFLNIPALVCKHRNEEGGLGFHFFSNATCGGDWIIQEVLSNAEPISSLLPDNAPLSTFRVITISECKDHTVTALSCVWRAGRRNAKTDHSAVLFDVDAEKNCFRRGITNTHWYQLGPRKVLTTQWIATHNISEHPDNGRKIEGEKIHADEIKAFAKRAHEEMMPGVPIVGWDVALTEKGMLMLECNLSCNFFLGTFDQEAYFNFVESYFMQLEQVVPKSTQAASAQDATATSDKKAE